MRFLESEKRDAFQRYFNPVATPSWPVWGLLAGVALAFVSTDRALTLVGVALALVGGSSLWSYRSSKVGDTDYDRMRKEDLDVLTDQRALKRWGIDSSELVGNPPWTGMIAPAFRQNISNSAFRKGDDKRLRYNPVGFAIIGFGEHQLFAYLGILDLITGNVLHERTEEFFYDHVVAVRTRTDSSSFNLNGQVYQFNETETFELTTAGPASISVPLRDPQLAKLLGGGEIPTKDAERAVAAVRAMLRNKRRSPAP